MSKPVGYSHLVAHYGLPSLPLLEYAELANNVSGRVTRRRGSDLVELFEPKYLNEDSLSAHLQFAFRYEGINLQVLTLLFAQIGEQELLAWIGHSPTSRYARIACYLYEWLTGKQLPTTRPVPSQTSYVQLADPGRQLAFVTGKRDTRYRVQNNLPGNDRFCPLIRITPYLREMIDSDLRQATRTVLARYDSDLLRRAAAFLYLNETRSSFEVEREKPSPHKAQRFADMLRQADTLIPLSEERLADLQQSVMDPRFHEFTWRREQNWIGKDMGHRQQIDFVPPRPEDVNTLMSGLLDLAQESAEMEVDSVDSVLMAAAIAFGFVYIHPFMDGNGRIHRYLIHEVLTRAGFTPQGIVLPVSAVILAGLDDYIAALEAFSKPLNRLTDYDPTQPDLSATGNDAVYFRYPDLTVQAEFLYKSLERTITHDLPQEIGWLIGFDRAGNALNQILDWPDHSMELFIRVVHENDGRLSANKRKSHFRWMKDDEVRNGERLVNEAFGEG
ncbi:MAG: Fic family protein [Pseudohongiellaceae bacterium]